MHNSLSQLLSRNSTRNWATNNQHVILRRFTRRRHQQPGSSSFYQTPHQSPVALGTRTASTIATTANQHGRVPYPHRALSSALAPRQEEDDDEELSLEDEIEALTASCFPLEDHEDTPEDIRHLRAQRLRMEYSSLDLELGEVSVWDSPDTGTEEDDGDSDGDEYDTAANDPLDFPTYPEGSPAAELHRLKLQKEAASPRRHQPVLSPLDMLERLSLDSSSQQQQHPQQRQQRHPDPLSYVGPVQLDDMIRTSNKHDALRQIQLQLECEAQHEAVQKYRRLTEQTRSRKDYASLSSLQKLILHWYQPIRDEIEAVQREYIFHKAIKRVTNKKAKREEDGMEEETQLNKAAIHCYGPLLNTVEPEKLAVILTHEALTMSIIKSQEKSNYRGGSSVVEMAQKLGTAVEEEVLLQRILKRKMEEEQAVASEAEKAQTNAAVASFASEVLHDSAKKDDTAEVGAANKPWSYAESRLTSYLKEMAGDGTENVNNAKNRRNIAYAVRRARRSLNAEDWSIADKVQVGTILLKILLDHATIRLPDGSVQPAFRMEKRWHGTNKHGGSTGPRFKSTNFILVHDALWKLAVADEFESIAATTTRHKPMVIPPEPWTSPQRGGYAWLKTDLIRFHGSQMQREALDGADLTTVLDGLNALSREAWVINKTILNVANACWEKKYPTGRYS